MQFNIAFITAALLSVSVAPAMAASFVTFQGADCTGTVLGSASANSPVCLTVGSSSFKSVRYTNVPTQISFFVSGGAHDNCTNGPQLTRGPGSGCATAPAGFNWESFQF